MLRQSMHDLLTRAQGALTYVRSGHTSHEWDISGSCIHPQMRVLESTPLINGRIRYGGWGHQKRTTLYMRVRCRMCDACKRLKQALWTARAERENVTGLRNWFGTLTLSPTAHHHIVSRCRAKLGRGGTDYDGLSHEEQFSEWMTEVSREVTLYIKRVRKESGAPLRYLLVAEAHKSGLPHLHLLVHEQDSSAPVRYRTLSTQWKLGFTKFNLVDGMKAARYVCKYISKSAMARVRASLRYGQMTHAVHEEETTKERKPLERPMRNDEQQVRRGPIIGVSLTDRYGGKIDGNTIQQGRSCERTLPSQFGNAGVDQTGPRDGETRLGTGPAKVHQNTERSHSSARREGRVPGLATLHPAQEETGVRSLNSSEPATSGREPGSGNRIADYQNGLVETPF